jgi:hypothetical protein
MEPVIKEVFQTVLSACTKEAKPIDIIKSGVNVLNGKPSIEKHFKKEILKSVIERIAQGKDGIAGTEDDRLSPQTVDILMTLVNSEVVDYVIDGIVAQVKRADFRTLFNRCGVLIGFKKFY